MSPGFSVDLCFSSSAANLRSARTTFHMASASSMFFLSESWSCWLSVPNASLTPLAHVSDSGPVVKASQLSSSLANSNSRSNLSRRSIRLHRFSSFDRITPLRFLGWGFLMRRKGTPRAFTRTGTRRLPLTTGRGRERIEVASGCRRAVWSCKCRDSFVLCCFRDNGFGSFLESFLCNTDSFCFIDRMSDMSSTMRFVLRWFPWEAEWSRSRAF